MKLKPSSSKISPAGRANISGTELLAASHVAHLLHRASQAADQRLALAASELETSLTPRQYAVLLAIEHEKVSRQVDLTAETGIDRSTSADLIRRLQRKGLVARRRSRVDARANLVSLTPAGEKALRMAQTAYRRAEAEFLDGLPKEMRQPFVAGLEALIHSGRRMKPIDQINDAE